jgi:hypothetical protein
MAHGPDLQRSSPMVGLYVRLLALYPGSFRREYAEQIEQLVHDRIRYDEPDQRPAMFFWLSLTADLVRSASVLRLEQLMTPANVARYGGPLGMIGGLLWIIGWTIVSSGVSDNVTFIGLFALSAITGSLITIATDSTLPGEGWRLASALVSVLGVVILMGGLLTGLWWLEVGAIFCGVTATILVGGSMLVSGWLSPVYAWGLIVASLMIFVSNTENWQVWLTVPFGVAWVAAGYALWMRSTIRMTLAP